MLSPKRPSDMSSIIVAILATTPGGIVRTATEAEYFRRSVSRTSPAVSVIDSVTLSHCGDSSVQPRQVACESANVKPAASACCATRLLSSNVGTNCGDVSDTVYPLATTGKNTPKSMLLLS